MDNHNLERDLLDRLERLTEIGVALSAERDNSRLLERILMETKSLTSADGGTLYMVDDAQRLHFEIVRTDSLGIRMGGTTGVSIDFPSIPLFGEDGAPNVSTVVAYAANHDCTINIPDAYSAEGFDFSGTRAFDQMKGYRSRSFLTVPMKNHEQDVIGVLQLINKVDAVSGEVVPFSQADQRLAESLASQAAVALTNKRLIDELRKLFEAFIQMIASANDEKSPYTGGHCRRVPELTLMLADATAQVGEGPFSGFRMNEDDRYELEIASWLHDCGKVVTPVNVVDKSTKLERIHDIISEVATRVELLKRDAEIAMLRSELEARRAGREVDTAALEAQFRATVATLEGELETLRRANVGGEFMSDEAQREVCRIGERRWSLEGEEKPLLNEDEIYNLNIAKGTLTPEEREIINNHLVVTIKMLEALPFPKKLQRVPEFAGGHHERMDGKGYPRGLTREQMSPQARMMAIADIFEALTARDRPYKPPKKLSETLRIMGFMMQENHIDPDLFRIFVERKVYLQYAERFLEPEQIDEVDPKSVPGLG